MCAGQFVWFGHATQSMTFNVIAKGNASVLGSLPARYSHDIKSVEGVKIIILLTLYRYLHKIKRQLKSQMLKVAK